MLEFAVLRFCRSVTRSLIATALVAMSFSSFVISFAPCVTTPNQKTRQYLYEHGSKSALLTIVRNLHNG